MTTDISMTNTDATEPIPQSPTIEPLLIDARGAAAMFHKSLRTWRAWHSAGVIPRPVRIGRSILWRIQELRDWVAAGCPKRVEWEAKRKSLEVPATSR